MKKVLIFGMTENPGGVETFLMNYYRRLNSKELHFDFLGATDTQIAYEKEIKKYSKVFHIPVRKKHPLKYWQAINAFFKKYSSDYDCIWVNLNTLINMDYLKLAKKYGIKKIIIHSHSSKNMDNKLKKYIHLYNKNRVAKYATDFWACSNLAAQWFYPEEILPEVKIIKNAIDVSEFKFDEGKRNTIRRQYNLTNDFVIGNVGRLHFEKNQSFAIDVFNEFLKINSNSKLILVGQGNDKSLLLRKAEKLGIKDKVIFTGVQYDMQGWYSAFDCFIFPSFFEGLGLAAVEAQANGLLTISASKNIPQELAINPNFEFLDLNKGPAFWASLINEKKLKSRISFDKVIKNFNSTGYNINTAVDDLKNKLMR